MLHHTKAIITSQHTQYQYLTGQSGRPPRHGIMSQMVDQVCDNRSGCDGNQTLLNPGPDCREKEDKHDDKGYIDIKVTGHNFISTFLDRTV